MTGKLPININHPLLQRTIEGGRVGYLGASFFAGGIDIFFEERTAWKQNLYSCHGRPSAKPPPSCRR